MHHHYINYKIQRARVNCSVPAMSEYGWICAGVDRGKRPVLAPGKGTKKPAMMGGSVGDLDVGMEADLLTANSTPQGRSSSPGASVMAWSLVRSASEDVRPQAPASSVGWLQGYRIGDRRPRDMDSAGER